MGVSLRRRKSEKPRWKCAKPALVWITLALLACGSDTTAPTRIEVAGSWNGSFNSAGVSGTIAMTLQETGGSVTGDGNLSGGGFATALTVTGTYAPPNAALALHAPGFSDISLSGAVSDRTLTGVMNGSGFVGVSITMARQ